MVNRYAHLAKRLFDTPLLIHPDKAQIIGEILAARISGQSAEEAATAATPEAALSDDQRKRFGTEITADGIAIIPVDGVLVRKSLGMRPYSGMRAYEDIQESVIDAATDPYGRGILRAIDTPGGEVPGPRGRGRAPARRRRAVPDGRRAERGDGRSDPTDQPDRARARRAAAARADPCETNAAGDRRSPPPSAPE